MIKIGKRLIGDNEPVFIIAEMSGNHKHDINIAYAIIDEAKDAGADAIKLQTYTADTITLKSDKKMFQTGSGGLWAGRTLYDLYSEAYTPWEWHPELKTYAEKLGLEFFSSPFDRTAVDFLDALNVPCYKIASFEINDIPLIKYTASKGKPIIISTGIAEGNETDEAVAACREVGNNDIILLKCTSAYPAPIEEANLADIADIIKKYGVTAGLSDHTPGITVPVAATAMGAKVIEKHLTLSKDNGAVDSKFSLDKDEFREMVTAVRLTEKAIGHAGHELSAKQKESLIYKRSLFAAKNIKKGELLTEENVKSVRPSCGLSPKYYEQIIGKKAAKDIEFAEPLAWDMIEK